MHGSLVSYLESHGWGAVGLEGSEGRMWRKEGERLAVSVPTELEQGGPEWELILDRLARVEGADVAAVERSITRRLVDVANLRAAKSVVIADTIPYAAGVSMVRDSWTMFRSCATTALGPRAYIAGNYRRRGDGILGLARMAHTRRGSFIIPILMPVPELKQQDQVFEGMESAPLETDERRVMRTFAESLSIVEAVMQPEPEPTANDMLDMIHVGVSHEFTSSLHRILLNESVAEFSAEFEWAAGAGPVPDTPRRVEISSDASERVDRVARQLKGRRPAKGPEMLTGPIVRVERTDDDTGGVVTIQTVRGARPCHVNVNVSRDRLDLALDWMKNRSTAIVTGKIRRTGPSLFVESLNAVDLLAHQQLYSDE